jgi:hypothetical protein
MLRYPNLGHQSSCPNSLFDILYFEYPRAECLHTLHLSRHFPAKVSVSTHHTVSAILPITNIEHRMTNFEVWDLLKLGVVALIGGRGLNVVLKLD